VACWHSVAWPMARMMACIPRRSGLPTPQPALNQAHAISSRVGGPPRGRGTPMVPGAGAAVASRIPTLSVGKVGRRRQLGRHSNVGNLIEASQGGVSHRRGLLAAVVARQRGVTSARPEERWVEPVVRLVGTKVSWWSSRMERRHRTRT
jgi:hypothetical protein